MDYGYQDIYAEFVEETINAEIVEETIEATIVEESINIEISEETLVLEVTDVEEISSEIGAEEITVEVESWSSPITVSSDGTGNTEYILEAGEDLVSGQPVCLSASGKLMKAVANNSLASVVYGFTLSDTNAGQLCAITPDGSVNMASWTSITGGVELTIGRKYYLSPDTSGTLMATAPTIAGQYVVRVGKAVSSTQLDIEIQPTILL